MIQESKIFNVTLNRNGWHRKLQKFVFNDPPMFQNLCPYFWLTIFCVLVTFIFPVVPLIKFCKYSVVWLVRGTEKTIDLIDKKICQPIYDEMCKHLPDSEVVDNWLLTDGYRGINKMAEEDQNVFQSRYSKVWDEVSTKDLKTKRERFDKWKQLNPDWEKKLEEYREKRKAHFIELDRIWTERAKEAQAKREADRIKEKEKQQKEWAREKEREARLEASRIKRQQNFNNIVKYTQKITPYLLGAVGFVLLYFIGKFFYWIWDITPWTTVGKGSLFVGKWFIILTVVCGGAYGLGYGGYRIARKCTIPAIKFPVLKHLIPIWDIIKSPFVRMKPYFKKGGDWMVDKVILIGTKFEDHINPSIKGFFVGVGQGFSFVWQYIKATKENYCPSINWVDEENKS